MICRGFVCDRQQVAHRDAGPPDDLRNHRMGRRRPDRTRQLALTAVRGNRAWVQARRPVRPLRLGGLLEQTVRRARHQRIRCAMMSRSIGRARHAPASRRAGGNARRHSRIARPATAPAGWGTRPESRRWKRKVLDPPKRQDHRRQKRIGRRQPERCRRAEPGEAEGPWPPAPGGSARRFRPRWGIQQKARPRFTNPAPDAQRRPDARGAPPQGCRPKGPAGSARRPERRSARYRPAHPQPPDSRGNSHKPREQHAQDRQPAARSARRAAMSPDIGSSWRVICNQIGMMIWFDSIVDSASAATITIEVAAEKPPRNTSSARGHPAQVPGARSARRGRVVAPRRGQAQGPHHRDRHHEQD